MEFFNKRHPSQSTQPFLKLERSVHETELESNDNFFYVKGKRAGLFNKIRATLNAVSFRGDLTVFYLR
jgi:hypothetical protein